MRGFVSIASFRALAPLVIVGLIVCFLAASVQAQQCNVQQVSTVNSAALLQQQAQQQALASLLAQQQQPRAVATAVAAPPAQRFLVQAPVATTSATASSVAVPPPPVLQLQAPVATVPVTLASTGGGGQRRFRPFQNIFGQRSVTTSTARTVTRTSGG